MLGHCVSPVPDCSGKYPSWVQPWLSLPPEGQAELAKALQCLEKKRSAALIHPEQTEALAGKELLLRNNLRMLCGTPHLYSLGAAALNLKDFVRTL